MTAESVTKPVVLQLDGLCFARGKQALLTNICVQIPPGVTCVQGGDGKGKSTLLRLMAGDLPPQRGSLRLKGLSPSDDAKAYRQQVFWVDPKNADALDAITPRAYWDCLPSQYPAFDRDVLAGLVDGLGLSPHCDKAMYMLSTGSKRKVWLAAAFAAGASLTLLDEPFAALDMPSVRMVKELLAEAAVHPSRAWVIADYEAPEGVPLAACIDLGD